jgi:GTP cyclohydrolase subunit MoaC
MSVRQVDISEKDMVLREAEAEGFLRLREGTIRLIREGRVEKGDVISVAKVAGIMAAKNTYQIIPLCHQIPLEAVEVKVEVEDSGVRVRSYVKAHYKTGVEMEALVATTTALLTVWDMVKKYEKDERGQYPETRIEYVRVIEKRKTRE